ncbi:HET domain-containing protein [Microdochium nivale]|nr:HET domain-containing protein [Microdochium nivale]
MDGRNRIALDESSLAPQVDALVALAEQHISRQEHREAILSLEIALGMLESTASHLLLLRTKSSVLHTLTWVHILSGDLDRARQICEQHVQFTEATGGKSHPATISAYFELFSCCVRQNANATAGHLLETILVPRMRADPAAAGLHARSYYLLGRSCSDRNMTASAKAFLTLALQQAEEDFKEKTSQTPCSDVNTSDSSQGTPRLEASLFLCQVLAQIFRLNIGHEPGLTREDCIVRTARVVFEEPQVILDRDTWVLFKPLLLIGDLENATIAHDQPWATTVDIHSKDATILCDGCGIMASEQSHLFACQACWDIDLCSGCYGVVKSGQPEIKDSIRGSCQDHKFLRVEHRKAQTPTQSPSGISLATWLSDLQQVYLEQASSKKDQPSELAGSSYPCSEAESSRSDIDDLDDLDSHIIYQTSTMSEESSLQEKDAVLVLDIIHNRSAWALPRASQLSFRLFGTADLKDAHVTKSSQLLEAGNVSEDLNEVSRRATAIIELALSPEPQRQLDLDHIEAQEDTEEGENDRAIVYEAMPLPNDGKLIRVLQLSPGSGPRLEGSLKLHELGLPSAEPYAALSYVWGEPNKPSDPWSIHVGRRHLSITKNLHDALMAIRSVHEHLLIWIDALCIDQTNDAEKSYQVELMTQIYRQAKTLYIHLGDAGPHTDSFVRFLGRSRLPSESFEKILARVGLVPGNVLAGYFDVCFRPWWQRVWVQQEHGMASQEPIFFLGEWWFSSLAMMVDGVMLFQEASQRLVPFQHHEIIDPHLTLTFKEILRKLRHTGAVVANRANDITRKNLHGTQLPCNLLRDTALLRCTDPRDRIYGLRVFLEPIAQLVFYPDYKLSRDELFERLAVWLLVIDCWGDMFWWFPYRLPHPAPSWAPDFSRIGETTDYAGLEISAAYNGRDEILAIQGRVLAVEAYALDVVEQVVCLEDGETWLEMVSRMWQLDCLHARLPTDAQRKNMPRLLRSLPDMHEATSMCCWADSSPLWMSSISHILGLGTSSLADAMGSVFDPVIEYINDQLEKNGLYEVPGAGFVTTKEKADQQDAILEHRKTTKIDTGWALAWQAIKFRLVTLQFTLIQANELQQTMFVGPALFDFENFCHCLEHLALPTIGHDLDLDRLSAIQGALRDLAGSVLSGYKTTHPTVQQEGEKPEMGKPARIAGFELDHSSMQNAIVNATYEQEVRLRATLVLTTAREVRRRVSETFATATAAPRTQALGLVADFKPGLGRESIDKMQATFADFQNNAGKSSTRQAGGLKHSVSGLAPIHATQVDGNAGPSKGSDDFGARLEDDQEVNREPGSRNTDSQDVLDADNRDSTVETEAGHVKEGWIAQFLDTLTDSLKTTFSTHGMPTTRVIQKSFEAAFRARTMLTTRHGLVAMGTEGVRDVRHGDVIVLLRGARYPLILRKVTLQDKHGDSKEAGEASPRPVPLDKIGSPELHVIVGHANVRGFSSEKFGALAKADLPRRNIYKIV